MTLTYDRLGYMAMLLLGLGALLIALGFPPESAIFPQIVSGVLAVMGGMHLLSTFVTRTGGTGAGGDDSSGGYQLERSAAFFDSPLRFAIIFALSVAYCVGIAAIGYYTSTALFIPISLLMLGYRKPVAVALATLGYVLGTWLLISVLFGRPLPPERILQLFG